jgi:hypothetical protein
MEVNNSIYWALKHKAKYFMRNCLISSLNNFTYKLSPTYTGKIRQSKSRKVNFPLFPRAGKVQVWGKDLNLGFLNTRAHGVEKVYGLLSINAFSFKKH